MRTNEIVDFSVGLSVTPPAQAGFSVPILLVDTEDVPIDKGYIITSRSAYADDLSAASAARLWATALWGQNLNPAVAYIGRWVSAALAPSFICGAAKPFGSAYTAVTAGDFAITNGTLTEQFTSGTLASCTSLADVLAVLQTEARTAVTLATALATCTISLDALGRVKLKGSVAGAAAGSLSIIAPTGGSGTDITGAALLNIGSGAFAVAGMDAEDPDEALARVLAVDNTPFVVCVRGASIAQEVTLATALVAYKKVGEFRNMDPDSKDASKTTDTPYQLGQLANKNVHICYTEHATQCPDAAIIGGVYPKPEGSASLAFKAIAGCYESGLHSDGTTVIPLTVGERTALETKGCDYLIKPVNSVHLRHGLTAGGVEMRLRIGYYWLEARFSEAVYAYLMANDVVTFSDDDIQAIGGIFIGLADVLVKRKATEPGYAVNLPTAAEFSAAVKATHTLTLSGMADLMSQFAINDIVGNATATV